MKRNIKNLSILYVYGMFLLALQGETIDLLSKQYLCNNNNSLSSKIINASESYFSVDLPDNIKSAHIEVEIQGEAEINVLNRTLATRMPMFWPIGTVNETKYIPRSFSLYNVLSRTWSTPGKGIGLSGRNNENKLIIRISSLNNKKFSIKKLSIVYIPNARPTLPQIKDKIFYNCIKKENQSCAVFAPLNTIGEIPVDNKKGWLFKRKLPLSYLPTGYVRYNSVVFNAGNEKSGVFLGKSGPKGITVVAPDKAHTVHFLFTGSRLKKDSNTKFVKIQYTDGSDVFHKIQWGWNIGNWYREGFPVSSFMGNMNLPKSRQIKIKSIENNTHFTWSSLYHFLIEAPANKHIKKVTVLNTSDTEILFLKALSFTCGEYNRIQVIPRDYTPKNTSGIIFDIIGDRPSFANKKIAAQVSISGCGKEISVGNIQLAYNEQGIVCAPISIDLKKLKIEPGLYQCKLTIGGKAYLGERFGVEHALLPEKAHALFFLHMSSKDEIAKNPAPHMSLMQRGGYDGIRLQIMWRQFENDNGIFDFTISDRILDACKDNNLKVEYIPSLYFTKRTGRERYGVPEKYVTSLTISNLGFPGKYQSPSLWDEKFLAAKCRMYKAVGDQYKDHPAFHSVYLCGIGHLNGGVSEQAARPRDLKGQGGSLNKEQIRQLKESQFYGFEKEAQAAFRTSLVKEYKSIREINRKFSLDFKNIQEIKIPADPHTFNERFWKKYLEFRVKSVDRFFEKEAEAFMASGIKKPTVQDIGNIARFNELYLGTIMTTIVERALKYNGEFSEDGSTYFSDAFFSIRYAQKHDVRKTGFESAIGASHEEFMRTVWNAIMLQIPDLVFVSYNRGGIFDPNSIIYKPYVETACSANKVFDDLSVYIYDKASCEMGIVRRKNAKGWWNRYKNVIDNLVRIGYSFDLCNETLKDAFSTKVVIDGINPKLPMQNIKKIQSYIKTGGTYIANLSFLRYGKRKQMEEVFGIKTIPYKGGNSIIYNDKKIPLTLKNRLAVYGKNCKVIAKYGNNKHNAIIEYPHGKGKLIVIACNLDFSKAPERRIYENLLGQAGVKKNIELNTFGIQNSLFEKNGVYYLFLMNLKLESEDVNITINQKTVVEDTKKVLNMNNGEKINFIKKNDSLMLKNIKLEPYQIMCFKLEKTDYK
jgi:hypothetical protein